MEYNFCHRHLKTKYCVNIGYLKKILCKYWFLPFKIFRLPSHLISLSTPGVPRGAFRPRRPTTALYDTINDIRNDREENRFSTRLLLNVNGISYRYTYYDYTIHVRNKIELFKFINYWVIGIYCELFCYIIDTHFTYKDTYIRSLHI